jgi:hypothetical protein
MEAMKRFHIVRLILLVAFVCGFMLSGCGGDNDWGLMELNSRPVADAGPDQDVSTGYTVTLDGTGSTDKEGSVLTYTWTLAQKPDGSTAVLSDPNSVAPEFIADVAGEYVVNLVVNDGLLSSLADSVTVTATDSDGYDYAAGEAYAWVAYSDSVVLAGFTGFVKINLATGAITTIQQIGDSNSFMAGADFVRGRYLSVQYGTNTLYAVSGDGTLENLTSYPVGVNTITGLAYDAVNDKIFVCDSDGASSRLFEIDPDDYSINLIGTICNEIVIGIAADASGALFGITLNNDNLYSINSATGVGTMIGSLGVDINYAQDIAYDRTNNILYGTLYSSSGGMYTINTTTGVATLIAPIEAEVDGLAIPTQPLDVKRR